MSEPNARTLTFQVNYTPENRSMGFTQPLLSPPLENHKNQYVRVLAFLILLCFSVCWYRREWWCGLQNRSTSLFEIRILRQCEGSQTKHRSDLKSTRILSAVFRQLVGKKTGQMGEQPQKLLVRSLDCAGSRPRGSTGWVSRKTLSQYPSSACLKPRRWAG